MLARKRHRHRRTASRRQTRRLFRWLREAGVPMRDDFTFWFMHGATSAWRSTKIPG